MLTWEVVSLKRGTVFKYAPTVPVYQEFFLWSLSQINYCSYFYFCLLEQLCCCC